MSFLFQLLKNFQNFKFSTFSVFFNFSNFLAFQFFHFFKFSEFQIFKFFSFSIFLNWNCCCGRAASLGNWGSYLSTLQSTLILLLAIQHTPQGRLLTESKERLGRPEWSVIFNFSVFQLFFNFLVFFSIFQSFSFSIFFLFFQSFNFSMFQSFCLSILKLSNQIVRSWNKAVDKSIPAVLN